MFVCLFVCFDKSGGHKTDWCLTLALSCELMIHVSTGHNVMALMTQSAITPGQKILRSYSVLFRNTEYGQSNEPLES